MKAETFALRLSQLMKIVDHASAKNKFGVHVINTSIIRLFADVVLCDDGNPNFDAVVVWDKYLKESAE